MYICCHVLYIDDDICILTVLFLNCVVYIHIGRGMLEHHGTLIQLKQRDDVALTVGAESTRHLFQNWLSCKVYTSNTPLEGHLQIDMYIYYKLLQLRYVYRHRTQLRYVYRHRTL